MTESNIKPEPIEFEVTRKRGYVILGDKSWEAWDILSAMRNPGESCVAALRRIVAERDKLNEDCARLRSDEEALEQRLSESHTCTIDGVTYRGNDETIEQLNEQQRAIKEFVQITVENTREKKDLSRQLASSDAIRRQEIEDFKRQLAEAKEQTKDVLQDNKNIRGELQEAKKAPAIPEKWRKAIEYCESRHWTNDSDLFQAAHNLVRAFELPDNERKGHVSACIQRCMNWLRASELEKASPKCLTHYCRRHISE